MTTATVIGGGLAGCEAAFQLARRGIETTLIEMRPAVPTSAHRTGRLAELVCSNSLKSDDPLTASGVLKAELRLLDCRLLSIAGRCSVPAGHALAVDRELFAEAVSDAVDEEPLITVLRREQIDLGCDGCVIVATGPLTSAAMCRSIEDHLGADSLHFYDAISISIDAEGIEKGAAYRASRYGRGGEDYLNIPLDREEYSRLIRFLCSAETVEPRGFESSLCFEACLPVEIIASRGEDALRYGPLKPRGLPDPRTGREPWAVVQLRPEKVDGSMYGLVGFQTRLTRPAQRGLLDLLPGLGGAEILRWGAIHRNTFIDSPRLLDGRQMSREREGLFFAGQLTGVEGYVESIAHGLLAGLSAACWLEGAASPLPPVDTMIGGLQRSLSRTGVPFQPMNANFGLLPPARGGKAARRAAKAERSIASMARFVAEHPSLVPGA
jgi:methylenetetrahydrofolate--tRNA-(uracil-5-)-methyltransferase